jgi:hypothetical protein
MAGKAPQFVGNPTKMTEKNKDVEAAQTTESLSAQDLPEARSTSGLLSLSCNYDDGASAITCKPDPPGCSRVDQGIRLHEESENVGMSNEEELFCYDVVSTKRLFT